MDIFTEYFVECTEQRIKDHYVIVYEVSVTSRYHFEISLDNKKINLVPSLTVSNESFISQLQLLEEMLDNGFPLATESNILKELIKPPSIVRNVVNSITGESQ